MEDSMLRVTPEEIGRLNEEFYKTTLIAIEHRNDHLVTPKQQKFHEKLTSAMLSILHKGLDAFDFKKVASDTVGIVTEKTVGRPLPSAIKNALGNVVGGVVEKLLNGLLGNTEYKEFLTALHVTSQDDLQELVEKTAIYLYKRFQDGIEELSDVGIDELTAFFVEVIGESIRTKSYNHLSLLTDKPYITMARIVIPKKDTSLFHLYKEENLPERTQKTLQTVSFKRWTILGLLLHSPGKMVDGTRLKSDYRTRDVKYPLQVLMSFEDARYYDFQNYPDNQCLSDDTEENEYLRALLIAFNANSAVKLNKNEILGCVAGDYNYNPCNIENSKLYQLILTRVGTEGLKKVENELKKIDEIYDLFSILPRIYEFEPDDSINKYLDGTNKAVGKLMQLSSLHPSYSTVSEITAVEYLSNQILEFDLANGWTIGLRLNKDKDIEEISLRIGHQQNMAEYINSVRDHFDMYSAPLDSILLNSNLDMESIGDRLPLFLLNGQQQPVKVIIRNKEQTIETISIDGQKISAQVKKEIRKSKSDFMKAGKQEAGYFLPTNHFILNWLSENGHIQSDEQDIRIIPKNAALLPETCKIKPGFYKLIQFNQGNVNSPSQKIFQLLGNNKRGNAADNYSLIVEFDSGIAKKMKIRSAISEKDVLVYPTDFRFYKMSKKIRLDLDSTSYTGIQSIKIREKVISENDQKLRKLESINRRNDRVRKIFKEDPALIRFLRDLLKNNMQAINDQFLIDNYRFSKLDNITLSEFLNETSNFYDEIGIKISAGEILKNIVLDANYEHLVTTGRSMLVFKTMELLSKAFSYIELMKNKDLVIFLGHTGSGKSTLVDYCLGLELEQVENRYGQTVVQIKNETGLNERQYAKIGQSIGASETAFVQGYSLISPISKLSSDLIFADCPGTKDTRGDDYELSAMLSIDQTIKNANSIKAIVLTLPYEAFWLDKANAVMELFLDLYERVPGVLTNDAIKRSVFLVINKHKALAKPFETIKIMLDEFLNVEENQEIDPSDDVRMEHTKKRILVWKMIQSIFNEGRVEMLSVRDKIARRKLIEKFSAAPGIPKEHFSKAMNRGNVQRNFEKYIVMSISTWQTSILDRYLYEFPDNIATFESNIKVEREKILSIEKDNEEMEKLVEQFNQKITKLKEYQPEQGLSTKGEEFFKELQDEDLKSLKSEHLESLSEMLQNLRQKIENKKLQLPNKEREEVLEEEIKKLNIKILELENEIQKLSKGSTKKYLFAYRQYGASENMTLCYGVDSSKAFNEVREISNEEWSEGTCREVEAGKHTGKARIHVFISRDYIIVPRDPGNRRDFLERGISADGRYIAEITGEPGRYELGPGKADPTGKNMTYSVTTLWEAGKPIPWFNITHTLPNIDINEANIVVIQGRIDARNRTIAQKRGELDLLKDEKERIKKEIAYLEGECQELDKNITNTKRELAIAKTEDLILAYAVQISTINNRLTHNKLNIAECYERIREEDKKIHLQRNIKVQFSVIIASQFRVLELLRNFSMLGIESGAKLGIEELHSNLHERCREFFEYCSDEQMRKIKNECELDRQYVLQTSSATRIVPLLSFQWISRHFENFFNYEISPVGSVWNDMSDRLLTMASQAWSNLYNNPLLPPAHAKSVTELAITEQFIRTKSCISKDLVADDLRFHQYKFREFTVEENFDSITSEMPPYYSSFNEQLPLLQWAIHYIQQWFPWDKKREKSPDDKLHLKAMFEKLANFSARFLELKAGIMFTCGLFSERLKWLERNFFDTRFALMQLDKAEYLNRANLLHYRKLLEKMESMIESLSVHEKTLLVWDREAVDLARDNRSVLIHYDVIYDKLTRKVVMSSERMENISEHDIAACTKFASLNHQFLQQNELSCDERVCEQPSLFFFPQASCSVTQLSVKNCKASRETGHPILR